MDITAHCCMGITFGFQSSLSHFVDFVNKNLFHLHRETSLITDFHFGTEDKHGTFQLQNGMFFVSTLCLIQANKVGFIFALSHCLVQLEVYLHNIST